MKAVNATIGGSQAAAAIGVSRWKSQMELWLEKTKYQKICLNLEILWRRL